MISHEHRYIFVHIPKTAGKSVTHALGARWQDHKDLLQYSRELSREQFSSYFKFTVVRNPWERLVSEYNFQWQKRRSRETKLFMFDERGMRRSFADWVRAALANPNHYDCKDWGGEVSEGIHRWSPQTDWISINGRIAVDFVARLENLQTDFEQICRRIGLARVVLPHKNRKLHWHYAQYYDPQTRRIVGDYYASDIEAFGYQFEGGSGMGRISKRVVDRLLTFWESWTAPRNAESMAANPARIPDR